MKKLLYIIFGVMGALMFIQCSDWTEMEPKFTEPVNINGEDYYKALREYKMCIRDRFNGYRLSLGRGFQPD